MSKPRDYERCAPHKLKAIAHVGAVPLCYPCVVCRLYADKPTEEIAKLLGRPVRAIAQVARKYGVYKSAAFLASNQCGRIQPGNVPHNKGLRRPGWGPGRMKETQFKRGERKGIAATNWRPIGTILPDSEGYLRIKVKEAARGEATGFGNVKVWPLLQRHNWEKEWGPIPAGHALVFKDRDRNNCDPTNLELLSRAQLMARNTVHNLPPELKQVIQLNGALKRVVRRLSEKQNVGSQEPSVRDTRIA